MASPVDRMKRFGLWILLPYIIVCLLSGLFIHEELFDKWVAPIVLAFDRTARNLQPVPAVSHQEKSPTSSPSVNDETCSRRFRSLLGILPSDPDPFAGLSLMMHRNGEAISCGEAQSSGGFLEELYSHYTQLSDGKCPALLNKYQIDSLLSKTLHGMLGNKCDSEEVYSKAGAGFLGFCDMGPKHTPILLDHNDLVPVVQMDPSTGTPTSTSLPCHFHTREGLRITMLQQLVDLFKSPSTTVTESQCEGDSKEQTCSTDESALLQRHLYAVPAGRVFMFAPSFVGEIFDLPHVEGADQKPIYLEVISLEPRVFDVFNFFSRAESKELVDKAIAETKDSHRIKRSTTGASDKNVNSRRTSESGFDTHGKTAVKVKKRCFKALGFDEYIESHGDGLQILRYNISKAYNSHLDWIEDKSGQLEHDFDSGGTGGNRFATILMYMSDLGEEDGGETVFPKGWPPLIDVADRIETRDALESLRQSDRGDVLERGSWEESLVAKCRSRLSIRPHSSRAVLFYSQYPNGQVDPASLHGACPVLSGQKYAANLWVWNTPRQGYAGAPIKEKFRNRKAKESPTSSPSTEFKQIKAGFRNTGQNPDMEKAELYYGDQKWGDLGPNDRTINVNTYRGHVWNIQVNGKVVKTWTIKEEDGLVQILEI